MKKIYIKVLFLGLLFLTNIKNIFAKNSIAFNELAYSLSGDPSVPLPQGPVEKFIGGIKLAILSPILIIGILLLFIFTILKIIRKDIKHMHTFLISGILGVALYFFSRKTILYFQTSINRPYYTNGQSIKSFLTDNNLNLVLVLTNVVLLLSFLCFLTIDIFLYMKQKSNKRSKTMSITKDNKIQNKNMTSATKRKK